MKLSRLLLLVLVVAFSAGVTAILLDSLRWTVSFWIEVSAGIAFIVAGASLPAAVCATTLDRGRLRGLMWSGIINAMLAAAGWAATYVYYSNTWGDIALPANLLMLPTMWALTCMMSAMLFPNRRLGVLPTAVGGAAWLASVASIILVGLMVWSDGRIVVEEFMTIFMVCMILALFGTMTALVVQRLPQLAGDAEEGHDIVRLPMHIWCPRCGVDQDILTGGANCERCGLSIGVKVP